MCLIVKKDETSGLTNRDTLVYKFGYIKSWAIKLRKNGTETVYDSTFFSPIFRMHYVYVKDILQPKVELVITETDKSIYQIKEGYHAWVSLDQHLIAYTRELFKQRGIKVEIGKFIIPANTPYYLQGNEIVSETIIYKGLLK